MNIASEQRGTILLVNVEGRIDGNTSNRLETALFTAIEDGAEHLPVDFSQVDDVSSAGLRVLFLAGKRLKQCNGRVVLSALQDTVKNVFDIAGFSAFFPAFPSQEGALESLNDVT